ncbi:uncharacterized protein Gasu_41740 [Galdieria sulphuraria]|uniref:Coiled-coil domain-containing protein n=1 Tax=Galdieria sulphuraria TaxID=130081 RepID=M2WWE5_GALSU|nr:uncharacterized protein Gasu_41740 [Galdieria sulphuraria]EME28330.1 hypothetical protein Gasu_41740 [Galdieria sulphuraria]|eukprot:XP_005704850.1 hypothetical protein Gasu_41740 [Galdieria sulphuraria]
MLDREQQLESFYQQASNQLVDFQPLFQAATLYEQTNQHLSLEECCAKLSIHLHTIEEQLYDKIWNSQKEFMETIQEIRELQQQLLQLSSQLKDTKQNLSLVAKQTYLNGDDIISLERRRKFLRRIQNSLVDAQSLIQISILAEVALKKDHLAECHNLCKQFESILLGVRKDRGDLTKLSCLRSLRDRITKVAVECVKRMHRNLRSLCTKLTKDDFWTIFIAYEEFDAAEALALRLNEEYSRALADVPAQFEMKYAEEKTKERHFSSLLIGFQLFSDILVSFHSLVAYLSHLSRNHDVAQQYDSQQERDDQQPQEKQGMQNPIRKQVLRQEFVKNILSHLISKVDFWELLQDRVVKWIQEMEKENLLIAISTMHMIYNTANLFQLLGEVFTSTSENGSLSQSFSSIPHDPSNVTSSSKTVVKVTEQKLQKSFEHQHEENIQIFRRNLFQETWQRINIEAADFMTFLSKFEDLANDSTFHEKKELEECVSKLLNEETNPLRVLNLDCIYSTSIEHEENKHRSISFDSESYLFVSSCLILLNIVKRYLELALSIPCLRVSILLAVGHLLQLYFCHVYFVCNSVCHRTEPELEKEERGRELDLEDFLHSKDRALLGQLRQTEDMSCPSLSNNSNISICDACVAVESWKSLADLFSHCLQLLETSSHWTISSRQSILRSWNAVFTLTVPIRSAVYDCIAAQIIEARRFIQEIANNNYSLHASHSIFQTDNIALLDQPSTAISRVLQNIEKWRESESMLPNTCLKLWERIAVTCCHTFVIGVSKVKHCTPEGRARMLVDLRHLERGLESLTGLRPIPGAQRAASHIRAYFLDEREILSWVEKEASKLFFTDAQLETLIETGPGRNLSRSAKNSLIQNVLRIYHQCKQNDLSSPADSSKYTHSDSQSIASKSNDHSQDEPATDDAVPMDNIFGQDI